MLHPKNIPHTSDSESRQSLASESAEYDELRALLLGTEYEELLKLQRQFSDHSRSSNKISEVISEAIVLRSKQDDSLTHALAPSVEEAIHSSVRRNPKRLANALFPVIGPAIRESVSEMLSSMVQQMNQTLDNSFSAKSIKWRIKAFRTQQSFAEVMLAETMLYQVEQVFLIHRNTSLLINHLSSTRAVVKDPDMVSGMLSAVSDFIKDSFQVDQQQNIKSIKFGRLNLLIEAGPYALIVAAVRGIAPADLQIKLREQLEDLHQLYAMQLEEFDGDVDTFPDTYVQLNNCLLSQDKQDNDKVEQKKKPWAAIAVLALLVLVPLGWFVKNKIEMSKWQTIVEGLQNEPGIVILDEGKHDGTYTLRGLRDPLAKQTEEVTQSISLFKPDIAWNWQSYYSTEPEILRKRIQLVLDPPPQVVTSYRNGVLEITGEADPNWIEALPNKLTSLWGIQRIDQSKLVPNNAFKLKMLQLVGALEVKTIEFLPNSSELDSNQVDKLTNVASLIDEISEIANSLDIKMQVGVLAVAGNSGSKLANIKISESRARNVEQVLTQKGVAEALLLAKGLGADASLLGANGSDACNVPRCVFFEVYLY